MRKGLATTAALLLTAPPVAAEIKQAGSVLPPGQSGFVSAACVAESQRNETGGPACDPHLTDQISLFVDFKYKNSMLGQPGTEEVPRPGVRILRDPYGVPSVYGDTDADAWWGAGYAIAQDRLFQIEAFRRFTTGTLAEILGKGVLEDDIAVRRDFYTQAEREAMFASLPAALRERYEAYVAGVNAWIAEAQRDPNKMPGEFALVGQPQGPAPLEVHEAVAIGLYLARTTPSGDGEELANLQAFQAVGPKAFNRVFPLRTPGAVPTIPRSEGLFPSRPGRTRKDERIAFKRSSRFAKALPLPGAEGSAARNHAASLFAPRIHGSKVWALQKGGRAYFFTAPQQGWTIPQRLVEIEIHSPTLNVRGTTAAGVPVIAIGHNEHVAWGVTSSLSDDNDLYAEQLVGDEGYRFRGKVEPMECRDETFTYRAATVDLIGVPDPDDPPDTSTGTTTERLCRTAHGPVQLRAGGVAYARRYATWKREIDTILGLDALNRAGSVAEADAAIGLMTWNENFMAADDRGNIGFWNPGLLPVRPKRWDERLPFPGTGRAEWAGFLKPRQRAKVINPRQGWLQNWNNPPAHGSTNGDGPAKERTTGRFHRARFLARVVARFARKPDFEALTEIDRITGTYAQQRITAAKRIRRARRGSRGDARVVLNTIWRWDGSYHRTDAEGRVDPGVLAWDVFLGEARKLAVARYPKEIEKLGHSAGGSHRQEATTLEHFALRTLTKKGYRRAAAEAMKVLAERQGSKSPNDWKVGRPTFPAGSEGGGKFPEPFPFFDRGSWTEVTELGP